MLKVGYYRSCKDTIQVFNRPNISLAVAWKFSHQLSFAEPAYASRNVITTSNCKNVHSECKGSDCISLNVVKCVIV